jgi:hypothetical protein
VKTLLVVVVFLGMVFVFTGLEGIACDTYMHAKGSAEAGGGVVAMIVLPWVGCVLWKRFVQWMEQ